MLKTLETMFMSKRNPKHYTVQKFLNTFASNANRGTVLNAEKNGAIPQAHREPGVSHNARYWTAEQLPAIGAKYGFLKKLPKPIVMTIFTTKGGVLKTTLALNIARMAALHNLKTCVIGLDLQGDITGALGLNAELENSASLENAIEKLDLTRGLNEIDQKNSHPLDLCVPTDLPTLFSIPETPELVALERMINSKNRREFWIKENVAEPLKKHFDLIVFDCSPNWNDLTSNAISACDFLVSPLECRIHNFRNFKFFRSFIEEFRSDLDLNYEQLFIPTKFSLARKLSAEIRHWYMSNVPNCTHSAIKESAIGEEAQTMRLSLPEHAPKSSAADEMREILVEIWQRIESSLSAQSQRPTSENIQQL